MHDEQNMETRGGGRKWRIPVSRRILTATEFRGLLKKQSEQL
jgi:hypothetical protein